MTDTVQNPTLTADETVARLRQSCGDWVHVPGDAAYDTGRSAWNAAVDQRPAAVAEPRTVADVSRLVRTAARLGLRVSVQSTGHGAGTLAVEKLHDVVLVRTTHLRGVYVDPANRIVRVEGGAQWIDVVEAAAPHGLAALHGSAPDIGVAGYALGGGLGWYARKHGLACNSIVGVELVTADGEVVRADARTRPDLFWAVRGGGGNFGVVTALELRLLPITDVVAGMLIWDLAEADRVVRAWATWCEDAPEEVTTSLRVMRFPPLPELPDFLRGRSLVVIDGVALTDDATAVDLLAPLRELAPETDTFARVPAASLTALHMDPPDPTPSVGAGAMLEALDDAAVDAFLAEVGPGTDSGVFIAEIRQLGGALRRSTPDAGALASLPASHAVMALAIAAGPEMAAAGQAATARLADALAPFATGGSFLNLAERRVDASTAYDVDAWRRLRAVRAEVDPRGLFLANHEIPTGS